MTVLNLRIAIVGLNYSPEPTGIAPYTTRLAERLACQGYEVAVLTGYPHYPEWKVRSGYRGWRKSEEINGVHVTRFRHFVPEKVTNLRRLQLELSFGIRLLFARWGRPDVILVVSPALLSSCIVLLRAKLGLRKPALGIWIQDIYSRGIEETRSGSSTAAALMKKIEGFTIRLAAQVAVIHDRFGDYLRDELAVPEDAITVIRNWTHVAEPGPFDRTEVRSRLGWSVEDTIVLHAGNMGVKQALGNVVEAARLAELQGSTVRFVLLGDGNQRRNIQELSRDVTHLRVIPPVPEADFLDILRAADVLLVNEMSGLREMAVPSKLTSYFSTGLPVIAATEEDSTTAAELESSKAGLRVQPDSPQDLLSAAERLGQDKALSRKLGSAGRRYADDVLSEDAAIVQYCAWLHELAAAPTAPSRIRRRIRNRNTNKAGGLR